MRWNTHPDDTQQAGLISTPKYPDSVAPVFDDIDLEERRWYGCVPVTTPARTIKDCRAAHVDPLIIDQAVEEGLERGLFSRNEIVK